MALNGHAVHQPTHNLASRVDDSPMPPGPPPGPRQQVPESWDMYREQGRKVAQELAPAVEPGGIEIEP
jgi:hypothetical protein